MIGSVLEREVPQGFETIAYGDQRPQFGHLRRAEGTPLRPAVMLIHGGFWRNRYSLDHLEHLSAALSAQEMVIWNIEYRRVGDVGGGWPGTFHDAVAAAEMLFRRAGEWGVDPDRILVMGHSAGGHLASWLGCMANVPETSQVRADPLPWRGVVTLAGVLDLVEAWVQHLSDHAVVDLLGGAPPEQPSRYRNGSPQALVPSPIPHTLLHARQDKLVPVGISERWHKANLEAGGHSRLEVVQRANHFSLIDPRSSAWPRVLAAVQSAVS